MRMRCWTSSTLLPILLSTPVLGSKDGGDPSGLDKVAVGTGTKEMITDDDEVRAQLVKRMPKAEEADVIANNLTGADPANIDQVQVDRVLSEACAEGVPLIDEVTNDAGILGCYNIPFLNTWTGAFSADLKLYLVSEPRGDFADIPPDQIQVELTYSNAGFSVVPRDPQLDRRRVADGDDLVRSLAPRQQSNAAGRTGPGQELQTFLFVGQINDTLALDKLEDKDIMALVIPEISLLIPTTADTDTDTDTDEDTDANTEPIPLQSSSIWFFVAGVFAGQNDLAAAAASREAADAAVAAASEFMLPGTTIAIFPISLIIAVVWTLVFLLALGYGTLTRLQYRDQFRTRKARAGAKYGIGPGATKAPPW